MPLCPDDFMLISDAASASGYSKIKPALELCAYGKFTLYLLEKLIAHEINENNVVHMSNPKEIYDFFPLRPDPIQDYLLGISRGDNPFEVEPMIVNLRRHLLPHRNCIYFFGWHRQDHCEVNVGRSLYLRKSDVVHLQQAKTPEVKHAKRNERNDKGTYDTEYAQFLAKALTKAIIDGTHEELISDCKLSPSALKKFAEKYPETAISIRNEDGGFKPGHGDDAFNRRTRIYNPCQNNLPLDN